MITETPLHLTARDIGLIIGVAGVGALAGSALAPWIVARVRTGRLIIGGVLLWALGAAIIAVAVSGAMVLGGELLINVLTPVVNGPDAGGQRRGVVLSPRVDPGRAPWAREQRLSVGGIWRYSDRGRR